MTSIPHMPLTLYALFSALPCAAMGVGCAAESGSIGGEPSATSLRLRDAVKSTERELTEDTLALANLQQLAIMVEITANERATAEAEAKEAELLNDATAYQAAIAAAEGKKAEEESLRATYERDRREYEKRVQETLEPRLSRLSGAVASQEFKNKKLAERLKVITDELEGIEADLPSLNSDDTLEKMKQDKRQLQSHQRRIGQLLAALEALLSEFSPAEQP